MNNITCINRYKREKDQKMFSEITNKIRLERQNGKNYSIDDAIEIAQQILYNCPYYTGGTTPINRIVNEFGIVPYTASLSHIDDISGVIYVGGTTKDLYKSDKVIILEKTEPTKHQRFVTAHELGHYLFDCLTNETYDNGNIVFAETYPRKNHNSEKEVRADRFAAELLMPREIFVEQYNIATDEKHNRIFTVKYLAEYFQVKVSSVERRINEVLFG